MIKSAVGTKHPPSEDGESEGWSPNRTPNRPTKRREVYKPFPDAVRSEEEFVKDWGITPDEEVGPFRGTGPVAVVPRAGGVGKRVCGMRQLGCPHTFCVWPVVARWAPGAGPLCALRPVGSWPSGQEPGTCVPAAEASLSLGCRTSGWRTSDAWSSRRQARCVPFSVRCGRRGRDTGRISRSSAAARRGILGDSCAAAADLQAGGRLLTLPHSLFRFPR